MTRARLRDLGIIIGRFAPGRHNAITDVPDVRVGHATLIADKPVTARTGVTAVYPRAGLVMEDYAFAGYHSFNGFGEMTGMHWVEESGCLTSPIVLTNTNQVGMAFEVLIEAGAGRYGDKFVGLPVVAETYDGWLNDIARLPLKKEHVLQALQEASDGPVAEGNVGAGTGTICYDFKGGIGTASRKVKTDTGPFVVGALVQSNHGERATLIVDGVPVGREIGPGVVPAPWPAPVLGGSIVILLATDAPLIPVQCKRLARRATLGLARTGGIGHNGSGDLILAFSTGNPYPMGAKTARSLRMLPHSQLDPLFEAGAEAVEEAILNSLAAAETMVGREGHRAEAIPLDLLQAVVRRYRPEGPSVP